MHILIIDDDKLICENIKSKLSRLGYNERYTILTVCNATEGEMMFDQYLPDIVITDIQMPSVSGLTLIERLSKRKHKANIYVLSGYDDYEYVRKAFLLGVTDYMLKPLDIDELDRKLKKADRVPSKVMKFSKEEASQDSVMEQTIRSAKVYIEENLSRPISMREVADHVNLSYNYFSKLFKEHTRCHFAHYFHQRRIELSKKYLHDPSFKVQDIAKKIGYVNPSEFSRAFKKYEGCYPTEYRSRAVSQN